MILFECGDCLTECYADEVHLLAGLTLVCSSCGGSTMVDRYGWIIRRTGDRSDLSNEVDVTIWEVIVGNIGTVLNTENGFEAKQTYSAYKKQSESDHGRASGESVVLLKNGDIEWEHLGC